MRFYSNKIVLQIYCMFANINMCLDKSTEAIYIISSAYK